MATLALSVAGAAIGSALLPGGAGILGATVSGAAIGQAAGAIAGAYIDNALFGASGQSRALVGPRLSDLQVTASTEGAPIPRLFGRARLGGQIVWALPLEEVATSSAAGGQSKGAPAAAQPRTDFAYYASFAVALCEGPISGIGRVWANGRELDLTAHSWRLHRGDEDQLPDPLIAAHLGADDAPAFRGTAYVVFERLALAAFGNRIPQLSFEVFRTVDGFEASVRGVVLIPGSGEFVYATTPVTRRVGAARHEAENTHTLAAATDWEAALDQLASTLPNARSTSLVVSWFGSDLRAGHCQVRPAVDAADKETSPTAWSVAGLTRATAPVVSRHDSRAAYGGTPSDDTVVAAIRDLKARGHRVTLNPFVLMDVPAGNALPDPYGGTTGQPAYPWRGRITCHPAPGQPGSPDKTAAAAGQVAALVGTALPAHFALAGDAVAYSGPAEWSFRRFILHHAMLAKAAGGVDAFLLCSELRGLTQVRSGAGTYPFVAALAALAADVKAILGPSTRVSYAADWSEYFGHHPADGSGDVHFHLDPLWASPSVDAVAIDCYWPLADWRDGESHLDRLAGARSIHDPDYLRANLFAGEGFDWYYASQADRDAQLRTPIGDGAYGKPWVFRFKDIRSWWENAHHDRPGGVENPTPSAWVPQSKPIWLTEIGCPAVDKGANQPNVFVDPKSSESFLPHYSLGTRDDLVQRRVVEAFTTAFDPAHPAYVPGANPVSAVYGGPMLDLDHVHVYAWDARPWPAFPSSDAWGDGANWQLGHWITGRIAAQPLAAVVAALLDGLGFADYDTRALDQTITGWVVERPMSAREALQPLELASFVDAVESEGLIRFRPRGGEPPVATLDPDDLVETRAEASLIELTRAQETDLPAAARLAYSSSESDYRRAIAQSRRRAGASGRMSEAEVALVMDGGQAQRTADTWLHETWAARERAVFTLPPSRLALEPGDVIRLDHAGSTRLLRITAVGDHGARAVEARGIDPAVYEPAADILRPGIAPADIPAGPALAWLLDLPLLTGSEDPYAGHVAAARIPWSPGGVAVYRSPEASGFTLAASCRRPATVGMLLEPLAPGPWSRLDRASRPVVRLHHGSLASTTPLAMLGGANAAAVRDAAGRWEVLQFERATLTAPATYTLSGLLRGQAGTEHVMAATLPAGAPFVLLDSSVAPVPLARADLGLAFEWRHGPADRDLGHPSFTALTHAFVGTALAPLAPVHVRGSRAANGDLTVAWIRRTRLGGDGWLAPEVPLAEETELYEVDILDGAAVKRTLVVSTPVATYTAAAQTSDFGSPQPSVSLRIHQLGTLGRGTGRSTTV